MLPNGEPLTFYVSAPLRSLVLHPYRPDFQNEFLPKLHAELWADWFGGIHHLWGRSTRLDRVTASTQSVLGFVGDLLALVGLGLTGVPAVARLVRGRSATAVGDVGWALIAVLAVASFAAYFVTVVRFPQAQGDPIKSSYLLFTAPCWAALSMAAWRWAHHRSRVGRYCLCAFAVLYLGSYGAMLGGAFT
jgi:hypothetical protein